MSEPLKLGLIGDNIAKSKAPTLHRLAGEICGRAVTYDRLVPPEMGEDFDAVLNGRPAADFRGVNVTFPYKERAAAQVEIDDPMVRAIGAVNTVVFEDGRMRGFNTDHSGFIAAFRHRLGADAKPGKVCLIGAGGVGRAVAFGLAALGAEELRLVDQDQARAEAVMAALRGADQHLALSFVADAAEAAEGADGLVNCTPVGMVGYEGTPLPIAAMAGARWAFDAVYTPEDTEFLMGAQAQGLSIVSGYELFFYQGVDAWRIFSGGSVDETRLREALRASAGAERNWG